MTNLPVTAKLKRTSRKNNSLSKSSRLVMTAIAKKVVMKETETKSFLQNREAAIFADFVYAQNLNFALTQGITSEQIVGEKFFLKNIYIKGFFQPTHTTLASNEPVSYRISIIRTKKALTNTFVDITNTDVYRGSTSFLASKGMIDMHKVDLLYDQTHYIAQPNQSNISQHRPFTINLKCNRTHFVDTDNGGYLKDKNYYLIMTCHTSTNVIATLGNLRFQWALNIKDS